MSFSLQGIVIQKIGSQDRPRKQASLSWSTKLSEAKVNRVLSPKHSDHGKHHFQGPRDDYTHGHHQMINTNIRQIMFFAAKDGEALYSQ